MAYQLTAKDKKFLEEKRKLQTKYTKLEEQYLSYRATTEKEIVALKDRIDELEQLLEETESIVGVDATELHEHMKNTQYLKNMLSFLTTRLPMNYI